MTTRRLGWIPDKIDPRDKIFPLKLTLTALPPAIDLTQMYAVPVVDQGNLGSCTGNGIAGALSYLEQKEGAPMVYPSRLFIYYNERVIEGTVSQDSGAEIRDGIKTVVEQGICPETEWPYDINKFTIQPPPSAYAHALQDLVKSYQRVAVDATSIMTALASGFPVIVGITVYDSFMNSTNGDIPMPDLATETIQGGHCVIVVGYDQQTSRFKFQNSWGTHWGAGGFGELPFAYLGNPQFGGDYWIITADEAASPTPPPARQGCLGRFSQILMALRTRKEKTAQEYIQRLDAR